VRHQHHNADPPGNRGRLVPDGNTQKPKLNCRNWESGVVIPILQGDIHSHKRVKDDKVFTSVMPVPLTLPGLEYTGDAKPWFGMER
jgi:hypothetical protein